jgi:hypothetical protein
MTLTLRTTNKEQMIDAVLLNEMFEYVDGELYRKVSLSNRTKSGQVAGFMNNRGYKQVSIFGKKYLVHRLVWLMFNNSLPKFIDHIDGNPLNNRKENLREATSQQNQQNSKKPQNNSSGHKNVTWCKRTKKWQVQMMMNYKLYFFGRYKHKDISATIAELARNKYCGEFARNA